MKHGVKPDKLRVIQFVPSIESISGGPVRSTLATCRAVHAADPCLETTWISTYHRLEWEWEIELRRLLPAGASLRLFPQAGHHTRNLSLPLLKRLLAHLGEYDLLVIRSLLHPLTSACSWVARRENVPYVVVPHGTLSRWTFEQRRRRLKELYFSTIERRTLEEARCVLYTCEAEQTEARRLAFSAAESVIPHLFEPRREAVDPEGRDPSQVLFLSRLDPKKGVDIVVAALGRVRRERPNTRLVLAGSGPTAYRRRLWRAIRQQGVEDAVHLPGFVRGPKKDTLLRRSSVLVLPSRHENFGIAVVEAMDAGLPVVVSEGVQLATLVRESGAGRVVARTPEAVATALAEILENPTLAA